MNSEETVCPKGFKQTWAPRIGLKDTLVFVFIVSSYFLSAKFGQLSVQHFQHVCPLWIPTGISLAVFLLRGYRAWPAIFLGAFFFNLSTSGSLVAASVIAGGNVLEGVAGAYLVNRYAKGKDAFTTPRNVFRFALLAGLISTAVSATIGVTISCQQGLVPWINYQNTWLTWWVGDAMGAIVVAPFLLLLFANHAHSIDLVELLELSLLMVGLCLVSVMAFGPPSLRWPDGNVPPFLVIPFAIWVAFRFCQVEAAGTNLILSGFAAWGSLHGFGPFANNRTAPLLLEMFVFVVCTMTLAVSAAVADRRRAEEDLVVAQSILSELVRQKTSDLNDTLEALREEICERIKSQHALQESHLCLTQLAENIPDVFWLLDAKEKRILYVSPSYEVVWGRSCQSLYDDPYSWAESVHPEDYERAACFIDLAAGSRQEDKCEVEYRLVRPDKTVRWILDRGFAIRDQAGRISRIAGLSTDITERKRREHSVHGDRKRGVEST